MSNERDNNIAKPYNEKAKNKIFLHIQAVKVPIKCHTCTIVTEDCFSMTQSDNST